MTEEWEKQNAFIGSRVVAGIWYGGLVIVRLAMCLVWPIRLSPEPGRGSNSMVYILGRGRRSVNTAGEDRFLFNQSRRNRFATATQLRSDLQHSSGVNTNHKKTFA